MSTHPLNLAFRFALELAALAVFGMWGWILADGRLALILCIAVPLGFAGALVVHYALSFDRIVWLLKPKS